MQRTTRRLPKVTLLAGFVGLILAIIVAHRSPVTGYELSIYGGTPALTWIGLGIGLLAGAAVSLGSPNGRRVHSAALVLVGAVALAVYAMPVLRGYSFYGAGDSLSHVGWASEIAAGTLEPTNLLYPGIHTLTVFMSGLAGVPLTLSNLYVVLVAIPVAFLLFIPPSVQLLADRPGADAVGLLAAAAFIPINNIAVHSTAHPASQAILLFAFVLYLTLATIAGTIDSAAQDRRTGQVFRPLVRGVGGLLTLSLAAIVLVHPQQALNIGVFFFGIVFLQLVARNVWPDHPLAAGRSLVPHTGFLIAVFALWALRFDRAQGAIVATIQSLLRSGPTGAAVVGDKSASLTVIGGSLTEIFLKLFGVAAVFSLVAGVFMLVALRRHDRHPLVALVTAGMVPVVGVFLVVLAANLGDMYFRYHGFLMVPVTVLGAAGLARFRGFTFDRDWRTIGTTVTLVLLLVLAPVGLVAVHSSPYIYQPTQHVTDTQIEGYGAAFEHRDESVPFTGLRGGPRRYVDFHYGTENARTKLNFPGYEAGISPAVFSAGNFSEEFEESRYLVTTESDKQREIRLYDGFRYPDSGFRALKTTRGVDRIRANDEFQLYYVEEAE